MSINKYFPPCKVNICWFCSHNYSQNQINRKQKWNTFFMSTGKNIPFPNISRLFFFFVETNETNLRTAETHSCYLTLFKRKSVTVNCIGTWIDWRGPSSLEKPSLSIIWRQSRMKLGIEKLPSPSNTPTITNICTFSLHYSRKRFARLCIIVTEL